MGVALPRFVALKSLANNKYLRFINEEGSHHGFLEFSGEEFLSLYKRFELEMAQTKFGLYNIRCCYTNKYLVPESSVSPCLIPGANEPNEEDHWSSTLFEPIAEPVAADDSQTDGSGAIIIQFRHFHFREYATASLPEDSVDAESPPPPPSMPEVTIDPDVEQQESTESIDVEQQESAESLSNQPIFAAFSPGKTTRAYETTAVPLVLSGRPQGTTPPRNQKFLVTNLGSVFILPKLVAFKAVTAGGQYLGARTIENQTHLQLVEGGVGDPTVENEVLSFSDDGSVLIKSKVANKVWRSSPGGIVADYDLEEHMEEKEEEGEDDRGIRFLPIKLGRNRVALQNVVTGKYCTSHAAAEGVTKCLNDSVDDATAILKDSIFEVHEPINSREIYNVEFNFLDARIYGTKVITLATQSGFNTLTKPTTMTFKLQYTLNTRSSWNNSVLFVAPDIETTLKSSVPSVVSKGEINITTEFEGSYEWGKEIVVSSDERERTLVFTIPPKTKVGINVLATEASCDVPFSYSRRDTLTNGEESVYGMEDGIYTGISYYNVKYEFTENKL